MYRIVFSLILKRWDILETSNTEGEKIYLMPKEYLVQKIDQQYDLYIKYVPPNQQNNILFIKSTALDKKYSLPKHDIWNECRNTNKSAET